MHDQCIEQRLREDFEACSWLHDRRYAEIVGRYIEIAKTNDLEAIIRVLSERVEEARDGNHRNPYAYRYFQGLCEVVRAIKETRRSRKRQEERAEAAK